MDITGFIVTVIKDFVSLTITVIPYFVIGVVVGALLETFTSKDFAARHIGDGASGVIKATALGAFLPGCACATIPMARGLKATGANLGVVSAFIMVSPLLSPHTLVLNYGMLGLRFTIARIIASLVAAIILGLVFNFLERRRVTGFVSEKTETPATGVDVAPETDSCCGADSCDGETAARTGFWKSARNITLDLGKYFILGMLIASVLSALIPEGGITKYISSSGIWAYASAVGVGIPLYVCEGEEIPIAQSLLKLGLGPGPTFAFLLGSVGTCIPTIIMARKVIGRRPILFYVIFWIFFTVIAGLIFQSLAG